MIARSIAVLALGLASHAALAVPTVPVPIGGTVSLTVPAGAFTNSLYVDVPANAERLTVSLQTANPTQDLDLLLRFRSPFPDSTGGAGLIDSEFLADHAQFVSLGATGNESIVITRSSREPLREGRLFLSVLSFANTPAPATVFAQLSSGGQFAPIEVLFDDPGTTARPCETAGWNDATARTAVRGNSGTTLGQQRRLALQEAARLLGEELRPNVPVRIRACFRDLSMDTSTSSGTTLAFASPESLSLSDRGQSAGRAALSQQYAFYARAAVAHQAGTPSCQFSGGDCVVPAADVSATFNLAIDNRTGANQQFDYGFSVPPAFSGPSFISVAMHEIAHGLGFIGLISLSTENNRVIGQKLSSFDDVYGRNTRVIDGSGTTRSFLRVSDSERAAALVGGTQLRFAGPIAIESSRNPLAGQSPPDNFVYLHSPTTLAGGSTYSHVGPNYAGEMMQAAISPTSPRSLSLALPMMQDLGWDPTPKAVPADALPANLQWYDLARTGHGIDMRRVAGTPDLYFLGYYSYDANGAPEWYTSLGRVVDGLFVPARNEFNDSLVRFNFRPGQNPQSVPDNSTAFLGEVRIDFVRAADSPACFDNVPVGRVLTGTLAVMTWDLDGTPAPRPRQWCMQPIIDGRAGVQVDLSSVWFAANDPGWGITVLSIPGNGGDGMGIGVYYPDATGKGRWGIVQTDRYVPGQSYPVQQVSNGYCRTCAAPAQLQFVNIGTITVDLGAPSSGRSNRISLDVTYPGPEGGRFQRSNVVVTPASDPGF